MCGFIVCDIDIDIDIDVGFHTPDSAPDLLLHDNGLLLTQRCDSDIKPDRSIIDMLCSHILYYRS